MKLRNHVISGNARVKAMSSATASWLLHLYGAYSPRNDPHFKALMCQYASMAGIGALPKNTRGLYTSGYGAQDKITINEEMPLGLRGRRSIKATVAHELAHARRISFNDLAAANAFGTYINGLARLRAGPRQSLPQKVSPDTTFLIEQAFTRAMVEKVNRVIAERHYTDVTKASQDSEYGRVVGQFVSFSGAGRMLGQLALGIEARVKVPGIGLFLIREVSERKPVAETMRRLVQGDFQKELAGLLAKDPYLRRLVAQVPFYQPRK